MKMFSIVAVIVSSIFLCATAEAKKKPKALYDRPNILVILTDDQTVDSILGKDQSGAFYMPNVRAKLGLARRFNNNYFTMSLCWPSRATMFSGRYPHNNGVDDWFDNQYIEFMHNQLDITGWPKMLQDNGYYTGQFGKFMNNYNARSVAEVGRPVGWDKFFVTATSQAGSSYHWRGDKYGRWTSYIGTDATVYQADVLLADTLLAVRRQGPVFQKPFAFILSGGSPHLPADPSPTYRGRYASEPFKPQTKGNFNEPDVADKPTWMQGIPQLTEPEIATLTTQWRLTLESARSFDDAFKALWDDLEASGQLANTYIIFASDNGFLWGEHRLTQKVVGYEESIGSVMYVWGPGVVPGNDGHLVSNIDWYATFAEIAGVPVPATVDGASLLPLTRAENPGWRRAFLVSGLRPNLPDNPRPNTDKERFLAMVTATWKFIRYDSGEIEFYDLAADPYEVDNKAQSLDAPFIAAVQSRIDALYACAGRAQCAAAERAPLPVRQ